MATTIKKTGATAVKISKPTHILVTPYADGVKGNTVYFLEDVLKDSTSITSDDNETTNIENELVDAPIKTITNLGAVNFTTTIEDMQSDILKDLLGFTVSGTKAYSPDAYRDIYAEIVVVLQNGENNYAYILPKVLLNAKLTLESLSSTMAGIVLAGTAMATTVDGNSTIYYTDSNYTLPTAG